MAPPRNAVHLKFPRILSRSVVMLRLTFEVNGSWTIAQLDDKTSARPSDQVAGHSPPNPKGVLA
jgi:hypothetical protein